MKRKIPKEEYEEESRKLFEIWKKKKTLTQTEFGKRYGLGNQSYVYQCLHGKVVLTLKAGIAFAQHLNCHISEFSERLDDQVAAIVKFDMDQKAILLGKKLFNRNIGETEINNADVVRISKLAALPLFDEDGITQPLARFADIVAEEERQKMRAGYQGCCYACEPVAEENIRLRNLLEKYREATKDE